MPDITTSSFLPAEVQIHFGQKLLAVPVPYLVYSLGAEEFVMPQNSGTTLRRRRYEKWATAPVPLGNSGLTPPAQTNTAIDIDCTIQFYGTYIILNEQVTLQNQDPVLNMEAKLAGISLQETEDELLRDMLLSSASFVNAQGGTNGDNPTNLARSDVDDVIRALNLADARTIELMIEGEDRFGTAPVRDSFVAMASNALIGSLERVDGFIAKSQYPAQFTTLRSEWGSISNLRFYLSSKGSVLPNASAMGADVYPITVCGIESYQKVEQTGYTTSFLYRPPILNDPLAQNATLKAPGVVKSSLIDLEAYSESHGDRAQAEHFALAA